MKHLLPVTIIYFLLHMPFALSAQTGTDTFHVAKRPVQNVNETKIYTFVEQNPEFPGGGIELTKFIKRNLVYPQMERDNKIQGTVQIRFVITEDGAVEQVIVMQGVSPGLDKEAVRVTKLLPQFLPGRQQGKPVRVYFNLPVVFKL